jgi:hypothetical protein
MVQINPLITSTDPEVSSIQVEKRGELALSTGYFNKTKIAQNGRSYTDEKGLQKVFCQWIDENYPGLLYFSTLNGEWFGQAAANQLMAMQSKRYKVPDFWLILPKLKSIDGEVRGYYPGLVIELKMDGEKLLATKTDKWGGWASQHIEKQAETLNLLRLQGWRAVFAVGLIEAKQQFTYYMSL